MALHRKGRQLDWVKQSNMYSAQSQPTFLISFTPIWSNIIDCYLLVRIFNRRNLPFLCNLFEFFKSSDKNNFFGSVAKMKIGQNLIQYLWLIKIDKSYLSHSAVSWLNGNGQGQGISIEKQTKNYDKEIASLYEQD